MILFLYLQRDRIDLMLTLIVVIKSIFAAFKYYYDKIDCD